MKNPIIIDLECPPEPAAGLRGFTDTVEIHVESGECGGEPGEFEQYMLKCIEEWYDGAHASIRLSPEALAKAKWNAEADRFNQWDSLGDDEKQELIDKAKQAHACLRKETTTPNLEPHMPHPTIAG